MITAAEGKACVVEHLHEQATLEGISFTPFEMRLLHDDELAASEDEIERFDGEHGVEFWAKISGLIRRSLARERRTNGLRAWLEYRRALKLAGRNNGYRSGVLIVGRFAPLFVQGWRGHLATIAVGTGTGLALVAFVLVSAFYGDRVSRWWDSSWFPRLLERYGAVAFFGVLFALVAVSALPLPHICPVLIS